MKSKDECLDEVYMTCKNSINVLLEVIGDLHNLPDLVAMESVDTRFRFLIETVQKARNKIGKEFEEDEEPNLLLQFEQDSIVDNEDDEDSDFLSMLKDDEEPKTITKKCWPEYFEKVLSGDKNFELRLADFECNIGDRLILEEYDPKTQRNTGRSLDRKITYIVKTKDLDFWAKEDVETFGYQIVSLGDMEP